ncbi:MAG TPA: hypothetical protein VJ843_02620 [Candidatus Saccharimonadales bacterium]|nr:hypothetical protein [Candidatus Saccharimonadales bacterium]
MSEHVNPEVSIVRRIGSAPSERGSTNGATCPDAFEVTDVVRGTAFAIIGERAELSEASQPEALLVVPSQVVYDVLADMVRA